MAIGHPADYGRYGERRRATWGARPDGAGVVASYNDRMTTITAETTIDRPARRLTRLTVTSFLAGVLLTAAAAIGVNAATGSGSSATHPAATHVVHAAPVAAAQEPGCFVVRGAC